MKRTQQRILSFFYIGEKRVGWEGLLSSSSFFSFLLLPSFSPFFFSSSSFSSSSSFLSWPLNSRRCLQNRIERKKGRECPDWPFHSYRASKSGDRHTLCSSEMSMGRFQGSEIVKGTVGVWVWLYVCERWRQASWKHLCAVLTSSKRHFSHIASFVIVAKIDGKTGLNTQTHFLLSQFRAIIPARYDPSYDCRIMRCPNQLQQTAQFLSPAFFAKIKICIRKTLSGWTDGYFFFYTLFF